MSELNASDIQGFVLRGYNMPLARYLFLHFTDERGGRDLINHLIGQITSGQRWDQGKPQSTLNIAFTFPGLESLDLPEASLLTFPVEFQQGMRQRAEILGDTGRNAPEFWDSIWQKDQVHAWLGVNAQTTQALELRCGDLLQLIATISGVTVVGTQDAASLVVKGAPTTMEHFGYTDGFGNPDYLGVERSSQPGQGKLMPDGTWAPLATGELLLGYADEAGELPVAPVPHLLAANGTFMVYRKMHQNVATFRRYLDQMGALYPGGKEKLAAKFVGRWRDGTPVEISPDKPDPALVQDPARNVNFTYGKDLDGARCPISAHIRRTNPRDAFGFNGRLIHRRRITRRGMPYGPYAPEDAPARDQDDRGVIFMALNASTFRQFEFIQQQWIEYGNDARMGNDKDVLLGNHSGPNSSGQNKFVVQGNEDPLNPPFLCADLPRFVELKGGDYFFLPSITALGMIALAIVDPR